MQMTCWSTLILIIAFGWWPLLVAYGAPPEVSSAWERLTLQAEQCEQQGNYGDAESALVAALKQTSANSEAERRAITLYRLGIVYRAQGRPAEAEKHYWQALSAWEKTVGSSHPKLVEPLTSLVSLYLEAGLSAAAGRLQRRCEEMLPLLDDRRDRLAVFHNLAVLYHLERKHAKAEAMYLQALADLRELSGPESQPVAQLLNNLAFLYAQTGRRAKAVEHFEQALAIWEYLLAPRHPYLGRALTNLAAQYCANGRLEEAESAFGRALDIVEGADPDGPLVADVLTDYAVLLRKSQRKQEAKAMERRARDIRQANSHEDLERHTVHAGDVLGPLSWR